MKGKDICNELKGIRRAIAEEHGIELNQKECTHTGDCLGTCPACEAELDTLNAALAEKDAEVRQIGVVVDKSVAGGIRDLGMFAQAVPHASELYSDIKPEPVPVPSPEPDPFVTGLIGGDIDDPDPEPEPEPDGLIGGDIDDPTQGFDIDVDIDVDAEP